MRSASPSLFPLWLRLSHWINAFAAIIMVLSGWRIYNATGFMGFYIPNTLTLGGWLAGALEWHFAGMWILATNGLIYVLLNLVTARFWRTFFPLSIKAVFCELWAAVRGKLAHDDLFHYNAVQKIAYLFVILDLIVLVLSGLVLWKSVQFPLLRDAMFGYEGARRVHFFAMCALVLFFFVHIVMVALVPRTLLAMLRGRP